MIQGTCPSLFVYSHICCFICYVKKLKLATHCVWNEVLEKEWEGKSKGLSCRSIKGSYQVWLVHFAGFRMVSCGRDNIRLWRLRNGMLRSCPVNLGEYHSMDFTDVAFEEGNSSNRRVDDRTLLVSKPVPILFRTEIRTNQIRINKKFYQKIGIFTPLWLFLIGLPAVGAAIYLRLTTAGLLSGISGGCCLHSSSMKTARRNGLLTQVCLEPVTLRKCWEKKKLWTKFVCLSQVQVLPSTASACVHHSVARALRMASWGYGPLTFLQSSLRLVGSHTTCNCSTLTVRVPSPQEAI